MTQWSFGMVAGLALVAGAGALTIGRGEAAPARHAARAPAHNWAATVTRKPDGAFVLGNPAAPVKLTEYFSMTCSHCALFAAEGFGPLEADYVRSGRVSVEFRHALRDPFDLAASLLSRCAGPAAAVGTIEAIFAAQSDWLQRATGAQIPPQPDGAQGAALVAVAHAAGLDEILRKRGVTDARQAACLANPAEQRTVVGMAHEAWDERHIPGTPAFLINGRLLDNTATWQALEPQLKAALGG